MNKEELALYLLKEELLNASTQLALNYSVEHDVAEHLEDILKTINSIDLDKVEIDMSYEIGETVSLTKQIIEKIKKKNDNETIRKKQFYVTPSQLSFLDDYAEKQGFEGNRKRSLALRTLLNNVMKNEGE